MKPIFSFLLMLLPCVVVGQAYPYLSNLSNTTGRNFVRTYTPQQATVNSSDISLANQNVLNCIVNTDYYDGLGRPMQSVKRSAFEINGIPAQSADLIIEHVYDSIGREAFNYLPFSKVESSFGDKGKLKVNPYDLHSSQYAILYSGDESYSETRFDNSPLNRTEKRLAPGHNFVGSNLGVVYDNNANIGASFSDMWIYQFSIGYANSIAANLPTITGFHINDGQLHSIVTTDEDGKWQIEYTDKSGHKVALMQHVAFTGWSTMVWMPQYNITYYVYDDFGRLRFIMPPEAYTQVYIYGLTNAIADGLCYQYLYDERGRLVEKKLPGKDVEYLIYDKKDRVVLSQDGNQRGVNQWKYSYYDDLDRVLQEGLYNPASTYNRLTMQSLINSGGITSTATILYYLTNSNFNTYPGTTSDGKELVTNYYDDYSNSNIFSTTFNASFNSSLTGPAAYSTIPQASPQTRGLLTARTVKVLDPYHAIPGPYSVSSTPWLKSANFYDENGRLIQTQKQNHCNGIDINTSQYNFTNQVVSNYLQSTNPLALGAGGTSAGASLFTTTGILTKYDFDYFNGNLQLVSENINDLGFQRIKLVTYDALGRIASKNQAVADNFYDYNIRNWITGINKNYFNNTTATNIFFCEKLSYENPVIPEIPCTTAPLGGVTPRFNGNISAEYWKGYQNSLVKCYSYLYDDLNRVTDATFSERIPPCVGAAPTIWDNSSLDYTMSGVTYDNNGNIQTMNQMGIGPAYTGPVQMDLLQYKYFNFTNKLQGVKDNATIATTNPDFKDDAAHSQNDYTYDVNGNLTADNNKGINQINYNYLDKPDFLDLNTSSNPRDVKYIYDALGNKLQKLCFEHIPYDATTITDYLGPLQYNNYVLHNINHEEGRSRPVINSSGALNFVYDYFIKDHLQNVRSVVTAAPESGEPVITRHLGGTGGSGLGGGTWTGGSVLGDPTAAIYLASHEIINAELEESVFNGLSALRADKPASINQTDAKAALLDGTDPDKAVGDAIMLRVMPGDRFSVSAQSYFEEGCDSVTGNADNILSSLINNLSGAGSGGVGGELSGANLIWQNAFNDPNLVNVFNNILEGNGFDSTKPAAFLNYVVYDDHMKIIPEKCRSIQINGGPGTWNEVASDGDINIDQAGYAMAYISSLASRHVWMDAVAFTIYRGNVLEENHYYPFGLNIETASTYPGEVNNYKFTTKELQHHEFTPAVGVTSSLELEDYGARMQDPQLGRWNGVDELAENHELESPYNYAANNPIRNFDADGKTWWDGVKGFMYAVADNYLGTNYSSSYSTTNPVSYRDFQEGQANGNVTSLLGGSSEAVGGGGIGAGGVAAAPETAGLSLTATVAGGAMVAHGTWTSTNAIRNMLGEKKGTLKSEPTTESGETNKRESTSKLRKKWSEANNQEWPKEPDNPNKPQTVSHKKARQDNGTDDVGNIEPMPANEHHQMHKDNGDYSRWRREYWDKKKAKEKAKNSNETNNENDTNK